jgi:hypothetical protein
MIGMVSGTGGRNRSVTSLLVRGAAPAPPWMDR